MPHGPTIQQMFAKVAPGYDRANRVLSLGVDQWWRRRAVAVAAVQPGERVLDVCAGTGDLTLLLARAGAQVIGADFCVPMLTRACSKAGGRGARPWFVGADALALPFAAARFDVATVAFGIRNVADPVAGLAELARVVRPGGRVIVLEFCRPRVPVLGSAYLFYFRRVLPTLGRLVAGVDAGPYQYLPDSVLAFPEREAFQELMVRAGLLRPTVHLLSGGIAAIYRAEVPA
ncbi:MAG TPA: ubiquinone/menaquinone biosynthesis methyltransferase [Planctomycetota bacterium]|nr:ubiquinone/menaquinone biosynthesis methyltransferase [Planctomycetota bacterium]